MRDAVTISRSSPSSLLVPRGCSEMLRKSECCCGQQVLHNKHSLAQAMFLMVHCSLTKDGLLDEMLVA
jgi:hypothetical protein